MFLPAPSSDKEEGTPAHAGISLAPSFFESFSCAGAPFSSIPSRSPELRRSLEFGEGAKFCERFLTRMWEFNMSSSWNSSSSFDLKWTWFLDSLELDRSAVVCLALSVCSDSVWWAGCKVVTSISRIAVWTVFRWFGIEAFDSGEEPELEEQMG